MEGGRGTTKRGSDGESRGGGEREHEYEIVV